MLDELKKAWAIRAASISELLVFITGELEVGGNGVGVLDAVLK